MLNKHKKLLFRYCRRYCFVSRCIYGVAVQAKNSALRSVEKLQTETQEQNHELEVINGVKDKLLSMIAHDVRSPLHHSQTFYFYLRKYFKPKNLPNSVLCLK